MENARVLTPEEEGNRAAAERNLWWWNLSMGVLHAIQAAICLGIGLSSSSSAKFRIQTITTYPSWSDQGPTPELQLRGAVKFVALTSGFAWMSAAAHFLVLLMFQRYVSDLRQGINRFRWFEYAASSSLMIVLIAMLFGVYDAHLLFMTAAVNACMNFFGYLHEVQNIPGGKIDWTSFAFGCFAGICPWGLIFSYISAASTSGLPGFVWGILIAYIVCFNTFPVNMLLQYRQTTSLFKDDRWGFPGGGYYFGEKVYQILSLVAKSLLLWLVVGGTNQPSKYTTGSN